MENERKREEDDDEDDELSTTQAVGEETSGMPVVVGENYLLLLFSF